MNLDERCYICPRQCGVDRNINRGFCGANNKIKINKVMLHKWEEPVISDGNGSGAIFFSNCSLKCVFCQNYQISHNGIGEEITALQLANIFKDLEKQGANNINLVSPTHYTKQIIQALNIYKPKIPIVWNTSGYEKVETIKMLKDYVDIYLTDLKYVDENISLKYSGAKDYFKYCSSAIMQMRENQPQDIIENGIMKKGMIVRHLVLPSNIEDSKKVLDFINRNLSNNTMISLMSQYIPYYKANNFKEINRTLKPLEYKIVVNYANKLGFSNGFVQDLTSADSKYTPKF